MIIVYRDGLYLLLNETHRVIGRFKTKYEAERERFEKYKENRDRQT